MPTLAAIKNTVDNWLAARWPTLQARQATYFASHKKYFQGLFTHLTIPIDGADGAADNVLVKPTDQAETWGDFVTLPASFPCSLRLDVYRNEQGWGYVATVRVFIAALNRIYERSQNVGSEQYRTVGWHEIKHEVEI